MRQQYHVAVAIAVAVECKHRQHVAHQTEQQELAEMKGSLL